MNPLANPLTWLLLAPLGFGLIGCLWALWRERDLRIALVAVMLAALAGRQLLAAPLDDGGGDELGLARVLSPLLVGFVTHVVASLAAIAIARSVIERNRAEQIHWEAMEAFRALAAFVDTPSPTFEQAVDELLALGCRHFGSEIGLISRIEGDRYHVLAVHAGKTLDVGENPRIEQGDCLAVDETLCRQTLERDQVVALEDTAARRWKRETSPQRFGFGSYLGAPVRAGDTVVGTICFASAGARRERFPGSHKELLRLMAHWLGSAIAERDRTAQPSAAPVRAASERARETQPIPATQATQATRSKSASSAKSASAKQTRQTVQPSRRRIAVDALVRDLEAELRAAAPGARLVLDLAAAKSEVEMLRYEFERLLFGLVLQAAELADGKGELHVETRRLESGDASQSRDAFVTLGVRATDAALDSVAMSDLLDRDLPASPAFSRDRGRANRRVSLSRLRRLLRAQGGDLSAHSGDREGTTLTSYLAALPLPDGRRAGAELTSVAPPVATG